MRRGAVVLDRLIAGVLAIALLAVGAWGLAAYFDVEPFDGWARGIPSGAAADLADADWYLAVLIPAAVLAFVAALAIIVPNVTKRTALPTVDAESDRTGELRYHLGDVAAAVGKQLGAHDAIRRVRARTRRDDSATSVSFVIDTEYDADLPALYRMCESAEADIKEAMDDPDLPVRFLVHVDRPPAN